MCVNRENFTAVCGAGVSMLISKDSGTQINFVEWYAQELVHMEVRNEIGSKR